MNLPLSMQLETADALATAKTDEVYQLQDAVFDLKKLNKKTKDEVGLQVAHLSVAHQHQVVLLRLTQG